MNELLTVDECAERLSVSRRTVYRLVRDGRLKLTKVRGSSRVTAKEIERFLRIAQRSAA